MRKISSQCQKEKRPNTEFENKRITKVSVYKRSCGVSESILYVETDDNYKKSVRIYSLLLDVSYSMKHFKEKDYVTSTKAGGEGGTYPGRRIARVVKFCTTAPDICTISVRNVIHFTHLRTRISRWALDVTKICVPLD